MNNRALVLCLALLTLSFASFTGCSKKSGHDHKHDHSHGHHHHTPPHGGTAVVLGNEAYHVELVLDATTGKLQAYLLDGELENFVRSAMPSFELSATFNGATQTLLFQPVANPATGETVGDTALFETQAEWLKTTASFDGALKSINVKGTTYTDVKFNFPKGNDSHQH